MKKQNSRKKFYAVAEGRDPGIYKTWVEAKNQVHQFSGAIYKSFNTYFEAKRFIAEYNSTK